MLEAHRTEDIESGVGFGNECYNGFWGDVAIVEKNSATIWFELEILKNGQDKVLSSPVYKPTPRHENLRGSEAYV